MKMKILSLLVLVFWFLPAQAQNLSLGLVAQFNLDGNTLDSSGNGIIATLPSDVTWTTDQFGNLNGALDFGTSGMPSWERE